MIQVISDKSRQKISKKVPLGRITIKKFHKIKCIKTKIKNFTLNLFKTCSIYLRSRKSGKLI